MGRTEECRRKEGRKAEDLLGRGDRGWHRVRTRAPRLRPASVGVGGERSITVGSWELGIWKSSCGELRAGWPSYLHLPSEPFDKYFLSIMCQALRVLK